MTDPPQNDATATPEARRELLRRLLEQRAEAADQPVSLQQERLWVAHHVDPNDPSQNLRTALWIKGRLDTDAFERSLGEVISRHDQLRATFHEATGRPVARIAAQIDAPIERLDLRQVDADEPEAEIDGVVRELASRPFDLSRGPLVRIGLLTLSESEFVAVLSVHHIVCDAWSMDIVLRDLLATYETLATGGVTDPVPLPAHQEYAAAQLEALAGPVGREQVAFWKEQLEGYVARPLLPYDAERPPGAQMSARRLPFEFPRHLRDGVDRLARSRGATAYMVLLTALAALLHRLSGADDIVVASPVANRQEEAWEAVVGYFVNLLPRRIAFTPGLSFEDALVRTRQRVLAAHDRQLLPVHKIAEAAGLRPAPLLRVLYQHVAAPTGSMHSGGAAGIVVEARPIDLGKTRHDFSLTTFAAADALAGILEYSSELFSASSAARFVADLEAVLEAIVADPAVEIAVLPTSPDWAPSGLQTGARTPENVGAEPVVRPGPAPTAAAAPGESAAEQNSTLSVLCSIWGSVLELDDISPFDNFLDIGGDSLLAMQVIERAETELGVRMTPADLFTQTLTELAASLEARRA